MGLMDWEGLFVLYCTYNKYIDFGSGDTDTAGRCDGEREVCK